ncbi:MAG: response regulator transcription factor [Phycisphaerales bacterium]|nr:MAG: response regulator transcription factor [Phycisphaerales bacterium]
MATRILLVDDHLVLRDSLRTSLGQEMGMEVVGEAGDGETAVRLARQLQPDLVLMDVAMTGMTGIDATRCIAADCPSTRILALSMHPRAIFVTEMLKAGASGYILKENALSSVLQGIKKVAAGEHFLCPKSAGLLAGEYTQDKESNRLAMLSHKEHDVLKLLAEGKSSKMIGMLMHLSTKTVDYHRRHIMEKLNVTSVAELVKIAIREGLTPLEV